MPAQIGITRSESPMAAAESTTNPVYVYGVVGSGTRLPELSGIDGAPLGTVNTGELAAIISDVPLDELELGPQELRVHQSVLEQAREHGTVLPMRFGVVMADAAAVRRELLDVHREDLREQLVQLDGKVELRVRAVYEEAPLLRQVVQSEPEIAALRAQLVGADEHAAYYARIRLGEMVAAAIEQMRVRDSAAILDALEPLAIASTTSDASHERVVLSASFLIDESRIEAFDEAVDRVGRDNAERMRLKYVGPLPPHSFVRLSVEA